jgi:phospholipase C
MANTSTFDPIKHVVVLMLENHSWDQMLGSLRQVYPGLDGVDPQHPASNRDDRGQVYGQAQTQKRRQDIDPPHNVEDVALQMADGNNGFVLNFAFNNLKSTPEQRQEVMNYFPLGFLPALHGLAQNFLICDRWFSSLPGPTWPNRFFLLSGTASGRVNMPHDGHHWLDIKGWFEQNQVTIFDRLNEKGIPWKVYFHGVPQSLVLMHQRRLKNAVRYAGMSRFFADARGPEGNFPAFAFIEPDYQGEDENDDHPPQDVMKAQKLVADVYNAIRANNALWESTLFVLLYDEHGGYYDHVVPPEAMPPDDHHEEYSFDRYGIRVPALLISPWVKRGYDSTTFDHTSLLKYLTEKWGLGPLGRRVAAANSIGPLIANAMTAPRVDTSQSIELTAEQLAEAAEPAVSIDPAPEDASASRPGSFVSDHHRSLVLLSHFLDAGADDDTRPFLYVWFARLYRNIKGWLWSLVHRKPASNADILARYKDLEQRVPRFIEHCQQVSRHSTR